MIIWILQLVFVPAVSPLCVGLIRKIKAFFQNRRGASVFQPYRDIWKLLHKDETMSRDASWIFRVAPFVMGAVTVLVGASIPIFSSFPLGVAHFVMSDFLIIVYALSLGTFFLALAGMDTGSAFGGFGSSREMTLAALAEGGLIFSFLTMSLVAGTTDVFKISALGQLSGGEALIPIILAFIGFFIVLLAETGRFPFDNPATHLELTMVHEAMILEYSGKRLALVEWASANRLLIFIAIGANLFFPFGLSTSTDMVSILMACGIFLLKMAMFCMAIAVIESSIAKFRFFRLPDLLFVAFILNVIAIGLI